MTVLFNGGLPIILAVTPFAALVPNTLALMVSPVSTSCTPSGRRKALRLNTRSLSFGHTDMDVAYIGYLRLWANA